MIDNKKRTTLKTLSGVAAVAAIPTSLNAAASVLDNDNPIPGSSAGGQNLSISMVSGHGRWHSVKLTNTSSKTITVKHVYPGIVSVDNKNYDVNSVFHAGPIIIEPGKSHVGIVAQQDSSAQEVDFPDNLTQVSSFELSTQYKHFGQIKPVVTTRNFFA